jgi:hypothetical protein
VIEAATGGDFDAVDAALESMASYSGGTADHLTAQLGTSSNRQDVFGGAIDGQSVNNTRYVGPSESIQTAIDGLASQSNIDLGRGNDTGHVYLKPAAEYDEGAEIHVKPGINLHGNGGTITHSGDHNLIFLDNGAHARNLQLDVDHTVATSASSAIVLDTTRSREGKYSVGASSSPVDSHASASGTILGNGTPAMHALELNDDATAGPITMGCWFDFEIFAMNDAIRLDSTNFINGVRFSGDITSCVNHIHHLGNSPADNTFRGTMQCGFNTSRAIWNETTADSISVWGMVWDPQNAATNAIVGPNIKVLSQGQGGLGEHSDGSAGQKALFLTNGSVIFDDLTNNETWEWDNGFNGALNIRNNSGLQQQWKPDGSCTLQGNRLAGISHIGNISVKSTPPSIAGSGGWYLDDGTNTDSGNPAIGVTTDGGSTWNYMD